MEASHQVRGPGASLIESAHTRQPTNFNGFLSDFLRSFSHCWAQDTITCFKPPIFSSVEDCFASSTVNDSSYGEEKIFQHRTDDHALAIVVMVTA
jgi:hypothetical protein